jgi:uncharacterized protein
MAKFINPLKNNEECEKIAKSAFQGVLCMTEDNLPYAVPINHAYQDGVFYFHCGSSGKKLDTIEKNPNVTYVINRYYGDQEKFAQSLKCHGCWESLLATGKARVVTKKAELVSAFDTFMSFYGREKVEHSQKFFDETKMILIDVEKMTVRKEYEDGRTEYLAWEPDRRG